MRFLLLNDLERPFFKLRPRPLIERHGQRHPVQDPSVSENTPRSSERLQGFIEDLRSQKNLDRRRRTQERESYELAEGLPAAVGTSGLVGRLAQDVPDYSLTCLPSPTSDEV